MSFDFLVSLDFQPGNTSLQRSPGCYAHVCVCRGWGGEAGSIRFLPAPSLPLSARPPAVEELLYVVVELARGGQPTERPGPARLLQLQLARQGTLGQQLQNHQAQQGQCARAAQGRRLEGAEQTLPQGVT